MAMVDKFLPKAEIYEQLSFKDQKKLKTLIVGDIICLGFFVVFSIALILLKVHVIGISMAGILIMLSSNRKQAKENAVSNKEDSTEAIAGSLITKEISSAKDGLKSAASNGGNK